MKSLILILFAIVPLAVVAEEQIHPQISRLIATASSAPEWKQQKTLSDKMWLLRKHIGLLDIVSEPVSDRYLITKFGGPIDLVHFLALSAQVCSTKYTLEEALFRQWKAEGGIDHEKGLSRVYYPEAHPDDLPSNAFGALLGSELIERQNDPQADLAKLLNEFFSALNPVDDSISKKYSHRYIVMGLPEKPSRNLMLSRSEWFTAKPLFLISALDPAMKAEIPNPTAALKAAGFEVYDIREKPIGIRRL